MVHLKLDELIHGVTGARNSVINLEHLSDEELKTLQQQFERLRKRATTQENDFTQPYECTGDTQNNCF